ncbi:MAG: hypothetical protein Hens3KO_21920 [Henriciella sp.]
MLHPSTQKLIDRLSEMTARGKIAWTDADDGAVNYVTEGYSVLVTDEPNELVIISKEGTELERAAATELAATTAEGGTYADILTAMTKEAKRIAKGTESAIGALLADMDETDAPPAEEIERQEAEIAAETAKVAADETTDETALNSTSDLEGETKPEPIDPVESDAKEEEPDVTAAVARLADEVNNRQTSEAAKTEDSSSGALSAAATGLATSVAMAELSPAEDTITEPEEVLAQEDASNDDTASEPEQVEAAEVPEPVNGLEANDAPATTGLMMSAAVENHKYTPFGLEAPQDQGLTGIIAETATEVDVSESAPPSEIEEAAETVEPANEAIEAAAPVFATSVVDDVQEQPAEASTESNSWASTTFQVSEQDERSLDEQTEPEAEPHSEASVEETRLEETLVDETLAAPEETEAPAPVEDAAEAEEVDAPLGALPETPPASEPQQSEEAPMSFSLSGIGAGFGLGALTAKTEASGAPEANAAPSAPERVVIDATDDVPFAAPGDDAAPVLEPPLTDVTNLEPSPAIDPALEEEPVNAEADATQDEQPPEPKPRTRFNPWS